MKANLKNGKRARVMVTPITAGNTLTTNSKTVFRPLVQTSGDLSHTQNNEAKCANNSKTLVCKTAVTNEYLHKTTYKVREINCQV